MGRRRRGFVVTNLLSDLDDDFDRDDDREQDGRRRSRSRSRSRSAGSSDPDLDDLRTAIRALTEKVDALSEGSAGDPDTDRAADADARNDEGGSGLLGTVG